MSATTSGESVDPERAGRPQPEADPYLAAARIAVGHHRIDPRFVGDGLSSPDVRADLVGVTGAPAAAPSRAPTVPVLDASASTRVRVGPALVEITLYLSPEDATPVLEIDTRGVPEDAAGLRMRLCLDAAPLLANPPLVPDLADATAPDDADDAPVRQEINVGEHALRMHLRGAPDDGVLRVDVDATRLLANGAGRRLRLYLNDACLHENPPYPMSGD